MSAGRCSKCGQERLETRDGSARFCACRSSLERMAELDREAAAKVAQARHAIVTCRRCSTPNVATDQRHVCADGELRHPETR